MLKKIDHIGIIVEDMDKMLEVFKKMFGLSPTQIEARPEKGLKGAFLSVGDVHIELLEITGPMPEETAKVIGRTNPGLHHICFEVENVDRELESLVASGVRLVDRKARQGLSGRVGFIHPDDTGNVYIELVQKV